MSRRGEKDLVTIMPKNLRFALLSIIVIMGI